jgi:hypothetical protein
MHDADQHPRIDQLRWSPLFVMNVIVAYDEAKHATGAPAGDRSLFPVTGGTFEGGRLGGVIEPGGMDWVRHRPDGVWQIDVRLMLRTHDDAQIATEYSGLTYAEPEMMERFLRREAYEFHEIYSRTALKFETGDERYAWLNHTFAVANGMRTTGLGPVYHVFAID